MNYNACKPAPALILFLLVSLGVVHGQGIAPQKQFISNFEVVAGTGSLTYDGYSRDNGQFKAGYLFGVGAYHSFTRSFDLNARLLFERKGGKANYNLELEPMTDLQVAITDVRTTKLNYLTLQLLPTFRIGKQKHFVFGAGGYFSLLLGGKVESKWKDGTQTQQAYTYYGVNPIYDAGLSVSAGYSFAIAKQPNRGMLQLMYNYGYVMIMPESDNWQYNRSTNLVFSYRLGN